MWGRQDVGRLGCCTEAEVLLDEAGEGVPVRGLESLFVDVAYNLWRCGRQTEAEGALGRLHCIAYTRLPCGGVSREVEGIGCKDVPEQHAAPEGPDDVAVLGRVVAASDAN